MPDRTIDLDVSDFEERIRPNKNLSADFASKRSVDFTILFDIHELRQAFRINASTIRNGTAVRLIARDIDEVEAPLLSGSSFVELTPNGTAAPKSTWFSLPAYELVQSGDYHAAVVPSGNRSGMTIVFGETGSGKSVLADDISRFIVQDYRNWGEPKVLGSILWPKAHILRLGDPVEGKLIPTLRRADGTACELETGIETTRNLDHDVRSLAQFGRDALRQKPTVITISELRSDREFRDALELAATGHPVVATAHAGSLEEGFLRLMKATSCFTTPQNRIPLAGALSRVIHVEALRPNDRSDYRLMMATVWTRTKESHEHFVNTGIQGLRRKSGRRPSCASPLHFLHFRKDEFLLSGVINALLRTRAEAVSERGSVTVTTEPGETVRESLGRAANVEVTRILDTVEWQGISRKLKIHADLVRPNILRCLKYEPTSETDGILSFPHTPPIYDDMVEHAVGAFERLKGQIRDL